MNKEILELLRKGVSLDEIKLKFVESGTAEEVAAAIKSAQKVMELEVVEGKSAAAAADQARVDSMVEAKLKSINFQPSTQFATSGHGMKSRVNAKGETVTMTPEQSEAYQLFGKQMKSLVLKDKASAASISKEIDSYNAKAAGDPIRTDNSATGGYAIPTEVDSEITQLTYDMSVMLQIANTDNIIVEDKIYPLMYGTTTVDITNQATDLTESQQTFGNPTVSMERFGTFSNVSNQIIRARADIVPAVMKAFATARAIFLDIRLSSGNITGASQLVDGIIFDANTTKATPIALSALTIGDVRDLKNSLSAAASGQLYFLGNRKVCDRVGMLENTAGNLLFLNYLNSGICAPFGIDLKLNKQILSTLDIGGDALSGTDDALVCFDGSKFIVGVDSTNRIESTDAYDFVGDNTTFKIVGRYGCKVLSGNGTAGIVAAVLELTN